MAKDIQCIYEAKDKLCAFYDVMCTICQGISYVYFFGKCKLCVLYSKGLNMYICQDINYAK